MEAAWDGRLETIRPTRVPGTWQFYTLRAGSPPGAAFSRSVEGSGPEGWTAPCLRTGNCPTD